MISVKYVDNFEEFYDKVHKHFDDHYTSCEEVISEEEDLSVNIPLFQSMIEAGAANVFEVVKDEEELVGYINVSISPSLILEEPQAVLDFIYILPEYRKEGLFSEALACIEKDLAAEGLNRLSVMLPNKDYSEHVAEGLGYTKTSTIYNKYIGE